MSSATSGLGLRFACALLLLGASSLVATASATDLRLSVTDTLLTEYRASNANTNPDDDNYGVFLNRLNIVASAGPMTASQRLDFVQFIRAPTNDYVSEIIPERINLRYRAGDWRLMGGDFYRQLGRGIVLSMKPIDAAGVDVALRGGTVRYTGSPHNVALFAGRANLFKTDPDMPDDALDLETIVDQLVIRGTVDQVVEQILAFRDTVGDFGTLLYAGHDWADKNLARRSMVLMAEEVMPRVNAAIGKSVSGQY